MVPSSRANTAALPSSTIVVSKVAHIRKVPFHYLCLFLFFFSCVIVWLIDNYRKWEVVFEKKEQQSDGGIYDEIIRTCRFCISEKFEESCLKGKRFFEKSRVAFVGPESSGLALDSKLLENPYGASASGAVLIQRGEVFVFARAFSFGGHY